MCSELKPGQKNPWGKEVGVKSISIVLGSGGSTEVTVCSAPSGVFTESSARTELPNSNGNNTAVAVVIRRLKEFMGADLGTND
jgi:hypothetical protein